MSALLQDQGTWTADKGALIRVPHHLQRWVALLTVTGTVLRNKQNTSKPLQRKAAADSRGQGVLW